MIVIKQKEQRVAVFLDVQNLYHSAKNIYESKVNFKSVLKELLCGRILIRCIGYVISTEKKDEANFFDALTELGIETKSKDLLIFVNNSKKADWDVGMAVDMIKISDKVDTIILVSGDGDFIPAIEYLKSKGCQVEVAAFGRSCSSKLKEVADDFVDLCEKPRKFVIYPKTKKRSKMTKITK